MRSVPLLQPLKMYFLHRKKPGPRQCVARKSMCRILLQKPCIPPTAMGLHIIVIAIPIMEKVLPMRRRRSRRRAEEDKVLKQEARSLLKRAFCFSVLVIQAPANGMFPLALPTWHQAAASFSFSLDELGLVVAFGRLAALCRA